MARAISDAHGLQQARKSGRADEARLALTAVFLAKRSAVEMDMLLSLGGTPMLECLQLVCDEMQAGTGKSLRDLHINALVPMLQQLFAWKSPSPSTPAGSRALDKQVVAQADEARVAIRRVLMGCSVLRRGAQRKLGGGAGDSVQRARTTAALRVGPLPDGRH